MTGERAEALWEKMLKSDSGTGVRTLCLEVLGWSWGSRTRAESAEGRLRRPPRSGPAESGAPFWVTSGLKHELREPLPPHRKMIYSLELMIWNDGLASVRINLCYLEKRLEASPLHCQAPR